jgi:Protein of unknown function (DUF2911)
LGKNTYCLQIPIFVRKDVSMIPSKALVLLLILSLPSGLCAQPELKPRPSPLAVSSCRYKDTYLKITYCQPHKRGREVFGTLVPFGQVWRTGANEATEVLVTRDIEINGAVLKAGSYSIFSIPGKEKWTIIFNSDLGLWGAYNYNSKMDVLRIEVPTEELKGEVYEAFTITLDPKNDKADLLFLWDKTKVTLSIKFKESKPSGN